MNRLVSSLFLLLALTSPAFGQTIDPDRLDTLAQQQKEAETKALAFSQQQNKVLGEISGLRRDLVNATAQSRGYEHAQNTAQAQLEKLENEEIKLTKIIMSDKITLIDMLAALQRIEKRPPPSLFDNAKNAVDAARAAKLLSTLSKDLQIKSEILKEQLVQLQILRENMHENRLEIAENEKELNARLQSIKAILSDKSKLSTSLNKDKEQQTQNAKALAQKSKNLRDLIAKFEEKAGEIAPRVKPKISHFPPSPHLKPAKGKAPAPIYIPKNTGRFTDARGRLPLPVLGKLSKSFGAKLSEGGRAKGISLQARPNAQVIAPFPARVEFSGVFNTESIVILNVGNGYFIVLTGLGETFTNAGEHVDAGQPLGLMPANRGSKPELFMEFRKNKASIDPKPWIRNALTR
ncbi:MAG: hypothetical protein COA43_12005 [Robiginitomaculum sp.]|nr:MAG: hypothetical protein COA43_12005 [Robiginitomaculum sp.]